MDKVAQLVNWINESNYTVVLTGAGMSTESGIPDFRSENGWWRNIDPQLVANIESLNNAYEAYKMINELTDGNNESLRVKVEK